MRKRDGNGTALEGGEFLENGGAEGVECFAYAADLGICVCRRCKGSVFRSSISFFERRE